MFTAVEPVPAAAPTYGTLVATAITPQDSIRWQNGVAWRPERCPQARTFDPCGTEFEDPAIGAGDSGVAYYRTPAFRVEDVCSTRGARRAEGLARVRRQAAGVTSYMVARELETGAQTILNPYDTPAATDQINAYLASPDATVITGVWDVLAGLGKLEEEARQTSLGMDVFIHMPVRLAVALDGAGALVAEGQLLRTRTGARVVADAGYSGRGPDVPGTSEVQSVTITGAPTGGTFTLTYSAQVTAAIAFDAAAATVQTALNNLSNLDGVTVSGSAGGPYTVTFPVGMGDVAQMTGQGAGLTGGTAPAVVVATVTPGVAPSVDAGLWMYATGPVTVRLDDIRPDAIVTHARNEITYYADRLFAAYFDPCNLHAIEVDDPAPAP
jgi:hypothetical protein